MLRRLPLALLLIALPAFARAQQPVTRADSAEVLIGAAERLDAEGSDEFATALARLVQCQPSLMRSGPRASDSKLAVRVPLLDARF